MAARSACSASPGEGSTFWFDLPERRIALAAEHPLPPDDGRRIIVCEDDETAGEILTHYLEEAGYRPTRARSAAEARGLLATGGFVAMTLLFTWMVALRYRIEVLADRAGDAVLEVTLAERWAEDDAPPPERADLEAHVPTGSPT